MRNDNAHEKRRESIGSKWDNNKKKKKTKERKREKKIWNELAELKNLWNSEARSWNEI